MKYKVLQDLLSNSLLGKNDIMTNKDIVELIKYNFLISNYDLQCNGKDIVNIKIDVINGTINLEVWNGFKFVRWFF